MSETDTRMLHNPANKISNHETPWAHGGHGAHGPMGSMRPMAPWAPLAQAVRPAMAVHGERADDVGLSKDPHSLMQRASGAKFYALPSKALHQMGNEE